MLPSKIIVAPDSFKGTLSSEKVSGIIAEAAHGLFPGCEIIQLPIADGGEGSVDCFLRCLPGEKVQLCVNNPFMEDMQAFYGLLEDNTAVAEMSACAGLPLAEGRLNPLATTTFGVGQIILDAARKGAQRIILGLGGSATNDAGCGAAAACGVSFYDKKGRSFVPTGGTLKDIKSIDISGIDKCLQEVKIILMCDIDNPMHGPAGAAYVFGPQKGASPADAALLDDGLRHVSGIIKKDLGLDVADIPGAGAAGAMGAGLTAFLKAELRSGIDTVLDAAGFDDMLRGTDLVITGEGRFDRQSLQGKAVYGIARRAKKQGVPVIVIAGGAEHLPEAYDIGVTAVFSINRLPMDLSQAKEHSIDNLQAASENIFRLMSL